MKRTISIPRHITQVLQAHLFQNELEQGAFLFANPFQDAREMRLEAQDVYLVQEDGWRVQMDVYLEMTETERAKIMALARTNGYAVVDCHSHPGSGRNVEFSPSDRYGIAEFAIYAKWKLDDKPFAAMVWGEKSVDAVIWEGEFQSALPVDNVQIASGDKHVSVKPKGSWFATGQLPWWRKVYHGG